MAEYQEDPNVVFVMIPGYPPTLRAEKRNGISGIYWAQTFIHDLTDIEYAKQHLTNFIHEQEREPTATGEGDD